MLFVFSGSNDHASERFLQVDISFSSGREDAEASARASTSYSPRLRLSDMAKLSEVSGMESAEDVESSSVAETLQADSCWAADEQKS